MITALRSMLQSYVYKVFLWVFLAVMIFGGLNFDYSDTTPWIFKVYKQKATELEYRHSIDHTQRQYDYFKAQGFNWPRKESIEKEVLRRMIVDMLLQNLSKELDLAVPAILLQEQLAGQLSSLPEHFFDAKGQINIAMLEKLIAPKTFASFLEDLESEIQANLLYNFITIGSYVPQFEVAMQLQEEYAHKKYSIVRFSLEKALHKVKEKAVSDETLERFYKKAEHGDTYKSAEQRAGYYWKFSSKHYGLTVSKADVAAYYEKNKHAEFLETSAQVQVHRIYFEKSENYDAKAQAQIVHDELMKDPATFATVAKKIAGAKLSYQGAEKTEYFAKDSAKYDKILVDTAFEQLTEDLAISNVIKTEKGYEILQRLGRKAAKFKSQQSVADEIEGKLAQEKFAKRFKQDAERLISNASYNKQALHDFIAKKHAHKEELPLAERKMGLHIIKLFQTEAGQYAVYMEGEHGIILECTQVQKRALKPFASIKHEVREDYYKKLAQEELQAMAENAVKQAAKEDLKAYAKTHDAEYETAQAVYETGQMDQSAVLRRPEVAAKVKALQSSGAIIEVVTPTESMVIRLDEMSPVDTTLAEEKKAMTEMTLVSKAKYKGRESFIASLYRHAKLNNKIEVREQLLKDIKDAQL